MKTKKALAVLLAVVMLVMPFAVSSFATESTIITNPIKTAYNDSEYFNPQGLVIVVDGEEIAYSPTDTNFRFTPALDELLTVNTTRVTVYYNNAIVGIVPVTVEHILGELTAIGDGHGKYCLGCATVHEFEKHYDYFANGNSDDNDPQKLDPDQGDYDYVGEWIPNDDGGIFTMQTETGICSVCKAEVTKTIPNSEKFMTLFDFGNMAELEGTIIQYVYDIAVSLIQMLVGIS